jgi:hypothetical protein
MAKSEARRQKHLAKKKARREEKRTYLTQQNSANPLIRLAAAGAWPIVEALVPEDLWDDGIGNLFIARRQPSGRFAFAAFLLDMCCLGVKDTFWNIVAESEYYATRNEMERKLGRLNNVAPEYFAKLVFAAVDYAQSYGFPPHADYRHTRMLLQGIDPSLCPDTFEFGQDGRPFYYNGPNDSPERINTVLHRLEQVGGHYALISHDKDFEDDDEIESSKSAWLR